MSEDKSKKKGFDPADFFQIVLGMVRTMFIAWLVTNVLLLLAGWLVVKLRHIDVDPARVWLARELTKGRMIDLQEVAPGIQTIRHVYRIDTDGDGEQEWVVLYSYDTSSAVKGDAMAGPYGAAVYDADRCRPPAIVSYELRPYDYDYVAESLNIYWPGAPQVLDLNADGQSELVLHIGDNLSLFRWFDRSTDCRMPAADQQGYEVLGTFRGTGGISWRADGSVVVLDRGFYDRSQIAVQRVYKPDARGSYLRPNAEGGGLTEPQEVGLTFALGQPITVTQSYYPEKAVLAFYLSLGKDKRAAEALLCPDADLSIAKDSFGLYLPRSQVASVLVKEIGYTPSVSDELAHRPREVSAMVVGVNKDGVADEGHLQRVVWRVRGVPKEGALPYNCEWCLESYTSQP